uniref:Uncharacterized protein n=1 Tax=Romanomermis culicivorax TaxID=13658 RepID=A0A915J337_ROMCU
MAESRLMLKNVVAESRPTRISLIIISLQRASGQFKNCRYEYSNYYKCLNDVNEDFNNIKTLNTGQWTQMENDVKQCYQIFQCQNPWFIDGVRNVRRSCFNTQRNRMRNDLQTCMRNYYDKNFDLQQEATENSVYKVESNPNQTISQEPK